MPRAVLDACVLFGAPLRDLLLWLAISDAYEPRWTEDIHREWMHAVRRHRPTVNQARLARTRELMDLAVHAALVQGYQDVVPSLELRDPDDRHVLAAAITAEATLIVTWNTQDFPDDALHGYRVAAIDPDRFILDLLSLAPASVLAGVRKHRANLRNPPKSPAEYLTALRAERLFRTVKALTPWLDQL